MSSVVPERQLPDVSEQIYIEQEALYFSTAAQSRGIFYYHALSFLLVPVLATQVEINPANKFMFAFVVAAILFLHVSHLVAFLFSKTIFSGKGVKLSIEATMIAVLCFYTGGFTSGYRYLFFLLSHYSIIYLNRTTALMAGGISIFASILLFLVSTDPVSGGELLLFSLYLLASAAASGEVASFIDFAHKKAVANVVNQVRASRRIQEQRNEIEAQGQRYRRLLETVNAIPWEFDFDTKTFTYIGPQAVPLFGYPLQDWYGKASFLSTIAHEADRELVNKLFLDRAFEVDVVSRVMNAEEALQTPEFRVLTANGEWKWVWCTSSSRKQGILQGVLFDITLRKHGELELARYQERLEEMVNERTRALNEYAVKLEKLAVEDTLTGLPNRRFFEQELDKEWRRAQRREEPIAVLMVDVDAFKLYNDIYGHLAGDVCLQKVANILKDTLRRAGDFVARYGGEEFVAVIPGCDNEAASAVAERMREAVQSLHLEHRANVNQLVTVSVGYASIVPGRTTVDRVALIKGADEALYVAKQQGKNRCVCHAFTDA